MTEIKLRSDMAVEVIQYMGNDEMVARAARVSTGNDLIETTKINGLINYLVREGHTSTLEHCTVTFRLEVPFFVRDQIVRHRTLSPNIESARYNEFKPEFYILPDDRPVVNEGNGAHPNLVAGTPEQLGLARGLYAFAYQNAWHAYTGMLEAGIATEVARSVLPVATYTSMYITANLNNWFKYLNLRDGKVGHPQTEIVETASQIYNHLKELYPITTAAWEKHRVTDEK